MMFAKWHFELERDLQTKDAWKKGTLFVLEWMHAF